LEQPSNYISLSKFGKNVITKIASELQKKYYYQFDARNENASKLEVTNISLYVNYPTVPKVIKQTDNQHQDLANFRAYFEWRIITKNTKLVAGFINLFIIDVGASTRLANSLVARVALRPILDVQDRLRSNKFVPKVPTITLDMTLQEFAGKNEKLLRDKNVVFNFTDVIYYIDDYNLVSVAEKMHDGVIAFGTLHIFKFTVDDEFQELMNLGVITQEEHTINMKVVGNETTYQHQPRFSLLLNMDNYTIPGYNFNLTVEKQDQVDFGPTLYISFIISKGPKDQIQQSNTFRKKSVQENVLNTIEEQNDRHVKQKIQDYKLSKELSYQDIYRSPQHLANIVSTIRINVPQETVLIRVRQALYDLYMADVTMSEDF
jgi:hypothetical protein